MSKTKEQKRVERRRRIQREINVKRNNTSKMRFRLDVELDGKWRKGVMGFKTVATVEGYVKGIEDMRKGTEVVAGRIVDIHTDRIVAEIKPSKPEPKGVLPGGEFVKPVLASNG